MLRPSKHWIPLNPHTHTVQRVFSPSLLSEEETEARCSLHVTLPGPVRSRLWSGHPNSCPWTSGGLKLGSELVKTQIPVAENLIQADLSICAQELKNLEVQLQAGLDPGTRMRKTQTHSISGLRFPGLLTPLSGRLFLVPLTFPGC